MTGRDETRNLYCTRETSSTNLRTTARNAPKEQIASACNAILSDEDTRHLDLLSRETRGYFVRDIRRVEQFEKIREFANFQTWCVVNLLIC